MESYYINNKKKYEIVLYLIETGVVPNLGIMREAMVHGQIGLVHYFYKNWNLVPTSEIILDVIEGDSESRDVIVWLFQNGFTLPRTIELPEY